MYRTLFVALLGVVITTPGLSAGDHPAGTPLFGGIQGKSRGIPIYPLRDAKYIKQYSGPVISCTNCFGYYRTTWRRWEEACGEPLPANPGPQQSPAAPITAEPEKKPDAKDDKKDTDAEKKDTNPKEPEKKDTEKKDTEKKGNVPTPMPLPSINVPKIEVPKLEVSASPSTPLRPMPVSQTPSQTVVVPIPSK